MVERPLGLLVRWDASMIISEVEETAKCINDRGRARERCADAIGIWLFGGPYLHRREPATAASL